VPYHQLNGRPNVIVDGSATSGTVLTLSHWPHSISPPTVRADLSAQMAFAYLDDPPPHADAHLVSNNHFDQDGLVSVFALAHPDAADARRDRLIDVAAAGDFATYRDRSAARASMVISAYADPARSPLAPAPEVYDDWCALLYRELLDRLVEVVDDPEHFEPLWRDEDSTLTASEALVESGAVEIEEVPELDLAVVTIPRTAPTAGGHRFGARWDRGLHPMALNNATNANGLLLLTGDHYEFVYRYESWVQYRTRHPRPRVDLSPLADELREADGGEWVFDGAGDLTPRLHRVDDGDSRMTASDVRARVECALATFPPAWDPYEGETGSTETTADRSSGP